jgi:beta-N-acetylhexosaminidase
VAVEKTWDELEACELIPFVAAINAGTDMIMAAHITAKNVTDDGLPASLSKEMITDKLRGELGYNGVVITDAMSMGAVTSEYTSAEAAVKAFTAGADIMLMPDDYKAAFKGIRDAVNDGTISMERLNESVLRILTLKEQYGILK